LDKKKYSMIGDMLIWYMKYIINQQSGW